MTKDNARETISVIVPVGSRHAPISRLYTEYKAGLQSLGKPVEFIFVLDGARNDVAAGLRPLLAAGENITVITLTRAFGEATALMAGFERATGDIILTLPAYDQIEASEIGKLVTGLDEADLVIANRSPRSGGGLEKLRRAVFHSMIGSVTGQRYNDLGCTARAMRRQVMKELSLYGDQHRFLPVLAHRQGFRVREIPVAQSKLDKNTGGYRAREYVHRTLDIFTVFFLVRFTHKPLRFFGMVGASTFAIGALLTTWLVIDRLFLHHALADRPALLLSSLLVVLGMQIFALGLLGELIIFTHARDIKDYQIAEVVRQEPTPETENTENVRRIKNQLMTG